MISLHDYNDTVKETVKAKFMGRNITLTKPDYVISDIDGALNIVVKNIKVYFHQRYDNLVFNMRNNRLYNHFEHNYRIDDKIAFYHFFTFMDNADRDVYHLLNKLGIEDASMNLITWNSDVIKKSFFDDITLIINKLYNINYNPDEEYKKRFDMASGVYADIMINNFNNKYNITIEDDLGNYNKESIFNYYDELLNNIIDKTLILYRNTMLLMFVDYIKNLDSSYNDLYNKMIDKKYINSFYEINNSKDFSKAVMNNIYRYPFVASNYQLITPYIKDDDFCDFKFSLDYLGILKNIIEIMNVDNHNFIYNNFSLDESLDKYREYVKLYCYLSDEDVDTYITRHMLLIQKEEIDKLLMMIEAESSTKNINIIFDEIVKKNRKFEKVLNKSCMSKAELNALNKKVNECQSYIKHDNIIRTFMYLVALGILIFLIIKVAN